MLQCSRSAQTHVLEHVGQHVPVLHSLAPSLPKVGHHGVARISDQDSAPLCPALRELRSGGCNQSCTGAKTERVLWVSIPMTIEWASNRHRENLCPRNGTEGLVLRLRHCSSNTWHRNSQRERQNKKRSRPNSFFVFLRRSMWTSLPSPQILLCPLSVLRRPFLLGRLLFPISTRPHFLYPN